MPRSRRIERTKRLVALALLLTSVPSLVCLRPAPASADPYAYGYTGGSDKIRQPDSRDHWHCKQLFPIHHDWLDSAMDQLDGQTVMYRRDSQACGPSTDVFWFAAKLPDGAYGRTLCKEVSFWGVCDRFVVIIDQRQRFAKAARAFPRDPGAWYTLNFQMVARHELGHTAGLHHDLSDPPNARFGPMASRTVRPNHPRWLGFLAYAHFQVWLINAHL